IKFFGTSTTFSHNEKLKTYTGIDEDWELSGVNLGIGIFGKYPLELTPEWTIFPILGFQFDICLAQNYAKDYTFYENTKRGDSYGKAERWSSTILKAGVGADFSVSQAYFFRAEILYDLKFNSELDKSFMNAVDSYANSVTNTTMGFSVKIAFGIKLGSPLNLPAFRRPPSGSNDDDLYFPSTKR
ncbi:MAG: hypothetical protein LBV52_03545, partial [Spirochaetaceae bacterium]|nr:hypothetical protein [Spirochaetaceae bacterium]